MPSKKSPYQLESLADNFQSMIFRAKREVQQTRQVFTELDLNKDQQLNQITFLLDTLVRDVRRQVEQKKFEEYNKKSV